MIKRRAVIDLVYGLGAFERFSGSSGLRLDFGANYGRT